MDIVKLIKNGDTQVVRLPKVYRMKGKEVYIKKVPEGLVLIEKENIWTDFERCLEDFPTDFLSNKRSVKNRKRSIHRPKDLFR